MTLLAWLVTGILGWFAVSIIVGLVVCKFFAWAENERGWEDE